MLPISKEPFRPKTVDQRINNALLNREVAKQADHHSTGDWDYSTGNWALDTGIYVSLPSSWRSNGGQFIDVFVKTSVVPIANVKEGRLVTQFRMSSTTPPGGWKAFPDFIFRYQDADNFYFVRFDRDLAYMKIYRVKATVQTELASVVIAWAKDAWHQIRVTWWNDYVGIAIRVEYYTGGAWVFLLDGYDSENNWKDIGGRVGFRLVGAGDGIFHHYVDDTDIYGVV